MLLTKTQAEAIYSAMATLNNVGLQSFAVRIDGAEITQHGEGDIHIDVDSKYEHHISQLAFAAAYDLEGCVIGVSSN